MAHCYHFIHILWKTKRRRNVFECAIWWLLFNFKWVHENGPKSIFAHSFYSSLILIYPKIAWILSCFFSPVVSFIHFCNKYLVETTMKTEKKNEKSDFIAIKLKGNPKYIFSISWNSYDATAFNVISINMTFPQAKQNANSHLSY